MHKISSGVKSLDNLIDSLYIGDNVVWEVDSGTLYSKFVNNFIKQSSKDSQKIIYISFNRSPQSILNSVRNSLVLEHFVLIDCFTAGKGKNDKTFVRFYEDQTDFNIVRIDNPRNIEQFSETLNSIEDSFPPGAKYIFDSLTGMQDLWGDENSTYKFFTYMCPRLYDLDTVAYWILEKDAHSQKFKANLRHITQVVLELYKRKDMLYIKALKLEGRSNREAFKPHLYEMDGSDITITSSGKEPLTDIGSRLKKIRTGLGMSQKELADSVDLTPSFISQLENNQISPSLSSFMQLCEALSVKPGQFLEKKKPDTAPWLFKKREVLLNTPYVENGMKVYEISGDENIAVKLIVFPPHTVLQKHIFYKRTREFIHILKGTVSVTVEGTVEKLESGDSVYFKEHFPAEWKNEEDKDTELLMVCS